MKITRLLLAGIILCITFSASAQNSGKTIWLKSGAITPETSLSLKSIEVFNAQLLKSGNKAIALLQFSQLPAERERKALSAAGIELLSYVPDFAYTVALSGPVNLEVLQSVKVAALLPLSPQQKMDEALSKGQLPDYAVKINGTVDVRIVFPKTVSAAEVAAYLKEKNFEVLETTLQKYNVLDVRIAASRLNELAASPYIEFVQAKPPADAPLNANSRAGSRANVLNASVANGGKGLNGEGVVIGIGDNANIQHNIDFNERILSSGVNIMAAHGVHVSGISASTGIINEMYRGYAPKAKIVSEEFSNVLARAPLYVQDYNMVLTNNSYGNYAGCSVFGIYETTAALLDQMAFDYPHLLNVFAAGNSGGSVCAPYPTSFHTVLGGFQAAKNVLTVGNTTDSGLIVTASSKGPVTDGRLKPEIAAMGTNVISNWSTNTYTFNTGTSMAAPGVTGGAALLYQRYRQLNGNADPSGALIKAVLCNGASDRGTKGPDYSYGFGWMNLVRSVAMLDSNRYFFNSSTNGSVSTHTVIVPPNTAQLKVMLYWNDPAASPASTKALVNDLDVEVTTPAAAVHLPQVLDPSPAGIILPSVMGADHLNNIEQVVIDNPVAGTYTLHVKGTAIAENPSQPYYVVYDFVPVGLKLTAPVGGENWAPTQFNYHMQKITWEADGFDNGTVAIEYSINGGINWITIATGIDIARRIFSWWVPDVVSGQALIRITKEGSGEITVSNPFAIIAAPVVTLQATQCPSYMAIQWPAVPGVTDYEVLLLQGGEMVPVATTTNTAFTFSGLSPDSTYWAGVRARAGGNAGLRSVAIARQPSTGSCSGTISDNDLAMNAIISPKSGRRFTSTELTTATPITVQIKNLDDAPVNNFQVRYSLNGAAWITESVSATIAAGGIYNHTFNTTINLSVLGSYNLIVEVINTNPDVVTRNNTLSTTIRQLDNQPLTLDFIDGLETAASFTYDYDTVGLAGVDRYDFENSFSTGRLKTFVNTGLAYSGAKAFTSEATHPQLSYKSTNYITGTFNLSNYTTAANDIRLDFQYLSTNQTDSPQHKVWIRGDDTKPWIKVYEYIKTGEDYRLSQSIEIRDSLLAHNQEFSNSFQVRWGHFAESPTIQKTVNFSFDDIRLYEVFNDLQMHRIDSPVTFSCGLSAAVPLKITVYNSHNTTLTNIPVKYSINNGSWVTEIITAIPANTSLQYTFLSTMDLSATGLYTIQAIVDEGSDSFHANDTATIVVRNSPLITSYPYLQNFEGGDGGFYAEGSHSSWEYGTPASAKISGAASGAKAWKTRLAGNYNDEETSYLYSPCFAIAGLAKPTLSFSAAIDLEDCGGALCDGVKVEYSIDGTTWNLLDTTAGVSGTNWYNKNYRVWSVENYTRWHVVSCALPVGASQIRFRFVMLSDPAVNFEGFAIDDVHVYDNTQGIYDGVTMASPVSNSVSGSDWVHFESGGKLIASINSAGQNLGATEVQAFINAAPVRHTSTQYYHNRNLVIQPQNATLTDSVGVRFYFLDSETEALINATGCSSCTKPRNVYELGVSKYSDVDDAFENGTISDNNSGNWKFILPANAVKVPFDRGYYAEFKVKDFSEFWLNNGGFSASTPLPVQLLSFTAKQENNSVLLHWETENEMDIDRYDVELAAGIEDLQRNKFIKLGEVGSKGAATAKQHYNYIDKTQTTTGTRYYRLKIWESDGSFTYSPVRSVVAANAATWSIYPNPSSGVFHFVLQLPANEKMEVHVYDANGKLVQHYNEKGTGFLQKLTINLKEGAFTNGMYLLQVTAGGKTTSYKLYKQ